VNNINQIWNRHLLVLSSIILASMLPGQEHCDTCRLADPYHNTRCPD
jgi:hypothetical protein